MDARLLEAFLCAAKTGLTANDLFPLAASTFYSNFLLPSRRVGSAPLDIKKSSFKKV
jgi:hypothetical protein